MKIIKLVAENIKKLKAIEISPEGNIIKISGQNEAGKSSVLDSIFYALNWKEASREVPRPIRDGAKKAQVKLYLKKDENDNLVLDTLEKSKNSKVIIVTRKWTSNEHPPYLRIETEDGSRIENPQLLLDSLVNSLSFDPSKFMKLKPRDQVDQMLELAGLSEEIYKLDTQREDLYSKRTFVNRDLKNAKGHLDSFSEEARDLDGEQKHVTSESIINKIKEAQGMIRKNDIKRVELENLFTNFNVLKDEIKSLESEMVELRKKIDDKKIKFAEYAKQGKILLKDVKNIKDPDITKYQLQLEKVEAHNKDVDERLEYIKCKKSSDEFEVKTSKLTEKIKDIDSKKEKAISNAKFPIKGLNFDEFGITYNNIPLKQCAKTQQLKVAVAIGMSKRPILRIIRILDAALFTKKNMDIIEKMAKKRDFQVWLEIASDLKIGIHIVEGEIDSIS